MIKETLAFLWKNSCSESSTLILETLNLQNSSIALLLMSNEHQTAAQQQTNKQEELRTIHQTKEKLKKERTKGERSLLWSRERKKRGKRRYGGKETAIRRFML
jgi:hypothetical protein